MFTANAFIQYYAGCQTTNTTFEEEENKIVTKKKNLDTFFALRCPTTEEEKKFESEKRKRFAKFLFSYFLHF